MNKEQKINYIKYWLQRFGKRDDSKFGVSVYLDNYPTHICLSYGVTSGGNICENHFWWTKRSEGTLYWDTKNKIEELPEETLDLIILKFENNEVLL